MLGGYWGYSPRGGEEPPAAAASGSDVAGQLPAHAAMVSAMRRQ